MIWIESSNRWESWHGLFDSLSLPLQVLPALAHLILHEDREVVSDTCWALSYLTDSSTERIQAVIDADVVKRLVQLLGSSEISCVVSSSSGEGGESEIAEYRSPESSPLSPPSPS